MTQAEKLNAALEKKYMTPGILARVMNVSPGWVTAIAKGWSRFDPWHRGIAERTLGLESGALKGDDEIDGHDGDAHPDAGPDAGAGADGGGGAAGETG